MNPKIIRAEDIEEKEYKGTKVASVFDTEEWPYFNVVKVRKDSDGKDGFDIVSNVVYYVLEGEGKCTIDEKEYEIKKGDCIVCPKWTKYKHTKGLTLLAISYPRFERNKRVYTE